MLYQYGYSCFQPNMLSLPGILLALVNMSSGPALAWVSVCHILPLDEEVEDVLLGWRCSSCEGPLEAQFLQKNSWSVLYCKKWVFFYLFCSLQNLSLKKANQQTNHETTVREREGLSSSLYIGEQTVGRLIFLRSQLWTLSVGYHCSAHDTGELTVFRLLI